MPVKDKTSKCLYIDDVTAQALKEIAFIYECSESSVMRKALNNYISLFQELGKKGQERKQHPMRG